VLNTGPLVHSDVQIPPEAARSFIAELM